jgi:hypothetical protein
LASTPATWVFTVGRLRSSSAAISAVLGRGQAVEHGHPDVHQHDVGPLLADRGDRLGPVRCLGDDLDALLLPRER